MTMSADREADRQRVRAELPGWEIWWVPTYAHGIRWCGRPESSLSSVCDEGSPDGLIEAARKWLAEQAAK